MILVCGEALMDVFVSTSENRQVSLDARIGGSPLNVAIGLARLKQSVAFFGGISTGALGECLYRTLVHEGIDATHVRRKLAPTTLSLIETAGSGAPSYQFYGESAADVSIVEADLPDAALKWQAIHVGSYLVASPQTAYVLRSLVSRERSHGRTVIAYDPNVRLGVVPDVSLWRNHASWMARHADIVKVSEEDLFALYPEHHPFEVAERWEADGAALVVVTRGSKGVWATAGCGAAQVSAGLVDVVDTVGAGDTFQAALLCALAERGQLTPQALRSLDIDQLMQALAFARDAAALTCSRRGADLPSREALRSHLGVAA